MTKARENSDYTGLVADIVAGDTAARAGRKNLIINGAMQVAQRGTSDTSFSGGYKVTDRWRMANSGSYGNNSNYTITQDSNSPDEFAYSMKLSVGADIAAPSSTQSSYMQTKFEKLDVDFLAYGTSNAKSVTLSFWVKSSLAGEFGISLSMNTNLSNSRNYTISTANTWEKKTLTFVGNTATAISGNSFALTYGLSYGSSLAQSGGNSWVSGTYYGASGNTNLGDTQNATWQVTGVQLEVGSVATDFEHRSYGEELALCQRYYWSTEARFYVQQYTSTHRMAQVRLPVTMRGTPTATYGVSAGTGWTPFDFTIDQINFYRANSYSDAGTYSFNNLKVDAEL